jgi:hypothetical protein
VDLNNDTYMDIVTIASGKNLSNDVIWFKGNKKGFEKGIIIKENVFEIDKNHTGQNMSTPYFFDIDGDKDLDMFVATSYGIFFNRNIGTAESPKFGERKILTTINGNPIKTNTNTPSIAIVDWDNDNILDIVIVAAAENIKLSYHKGLGNEKFGVAVTIPIMSEVKDENSENFISGTNSWICSTDWNNDGKSDILLGSSLSYSNGKILNNPNDLDEYIYTQFANKYGEIDQKKIEKFYKSIKTYGVIYLLLGK